LSRRAFLKWIGTTAGVGAGYAVLSKVVAVLAFPARSAEPQSKRTTGTVEERVKRIIVEHLGVDEAKVVPKARLAEDLGADSLDVVELVLALEEAFDIEIPEEEGEKLRTVNDVIRCVQSHVKTPKKSTDSKGNS
jgi:acyl carrier protein